VEIGGTAHPRILILTLFHGAAHARAAKALHQALLKLQPGAVVKVTDALHECAGWFRGYYDSYGVLLKYWPSLWGWIEIIQHQSKSTGPKWLYRKGAQRLFRFVDDFHPDVVVATEVGVCELTAMLKREGRGSFRLVAVELMDFNRAWVQAEVDLYLGTHEDLGAELEMAGAPRGQIRCCGQPIDPSFSSLPSQTAARARLGIEPGIPTLLVLFGGTGFGKPKLIVNQLQRIQTPLQIVFIAGKNSQMQGEIRSISKVLQRTRVLGWVENIQEWMVAADLMLSKPGGATLTEGLACGLPMLAFDPLPGNERRTCGWIEKWGVGRWIRNAKDLAPSIEELLTNREELTKLRAQAQAAGRPQEADDAAGAILRLC
jgi:processive 1,2-diacylglycerol beta-glucosyltransferase